MEVELRFALGCLAEGDDVDFIFGLLVNDGNGDTGK
jgi:hypothetical protein